MALLHSVSEECVKSELDLFTLPLTQTSIEKCTYLEILPLSAIIDTEQLEFYHPAATTASISITRFYIYVLKLPILMELIWDNGIGLINYPGCTLVDS